MHFTNSFCIALGVLAMSNAISGAPTSKRGPSGLLAAIAEAQANNPDPGEPVELNLATGGDPNADDPSFRKRQSFDAEDCQANDLSFGQQRQCIDAGFLDDPSFRKRQSFDAQDCASNDLSFGQQRQCIDAGLLDDPSFRKRQSFDAEDCQSNDLSFGQQRQCIDAGLLDDPSF